MKFEEFWVRSRFSTDLQVPRDAWYMFMEPRLRVRAPSIERYVLGAVTTSAIRLITICPRVLIDAKFYHSPSTCSSLQRLNTEKKVRAQGIKIKRTQTYSTIFSTEKEIERDHRLRNMQRKQKGEKRRKPPENKRIYFVMPIIAKHFYGLWPRAWENRWYSSLKQACLSLKRMIFLSYTGMPLFKTDDIPLSHRHAFL